RGRAWRRIALLVKLRRKTEEIVNRLGACRRAHGGLWRVPMRGDHEYLARLRQLCSERGPRARLAHVLDGDRRRAMREKDGGKFHACFSTWRRPRGSSTKTRIARDTTKKAPVSRIASRWLPPVTQVTAP